MKVKELTINKIYDLEEELKNDIINLLDEFEKKTNSTIKQITLYKTGNEKHINLNIDFGI